VPIKPWLPPEVKLPPPPGAARIQRRFYMTDRNGVEIEITSNAQLQKILAQMTPQELADWKQRYRFTSIDNDTPGDCITGGMRDL
jgi:hypothetical protein